MKPVLIIGAVSREIALLEQTLESPHCPALSAFPVVSGTIGTLPVILCLSGVGKINAAAATALMIERCQPQLVISTGCAGAYRESGLEIGGLAVADCEILGDEGAITSGGWLGLEEMGLPYLVQEKERYFNKIPLSGRHVEQTVNLAEKSGTGLMRGRFVTVSTCSGSDQAGAELERRWNAICENMEGAAVALTCRRFGIDCLEIRGISNLVEERNMAAWDIGAAVEAAQQFVVRYLKSMQENNAL